MGARILIIEDNLANLELMGYLLRAFGHSPIEAHDGEEGIEAARRERPDLILCDVQMPRVDGYEVARRLKEDRELSRIPLLAITARAMVGDRERLLGSGFDGYLPKPIHPETFLAQVESILKAPARAGRGPAQARATEPGPPPAAAEGASVLVVDDTQANRELLQSLLPPFGYTVSAAGSVPRGLAMARQAPPALIVSDLHMGGEGGADLLRQVKQDSSLKDIPVMILTSSVWGDRERERCLKLGARKFVVRPIGPQALLSEIRECLEREGG